MRSAPTITTPEHRVAFSKASVENLHSDWEMDRQVLGQFSTIGKIVLSDEVRFKLTEELSRIPYGPASNHNYAFERIPSASEVESIKGRNALLTPSVKDILDITAQTFCNFVQSDVQNQIGTVAGWDTVVRLGTYTEAAHDLSNNPHIDGGPPLIRYVVAPLGAVSLFATTPISQSQVSGTGLLYDPDIPLQQVEEGDIIRFTAFTPHVAPPPDENSRLFISATAWL